MAAREKRREGRPEPVSLAFGAGPVPCTSGNGYGTQGSKPRQDLLDVGGTLRVAQKSGREGQSIGRERTCSDSLRSSRCRIYVLVQCRGQRTAEVQEVLARFGRWCGIVAHLPRSTRAPRCGLRWGAAGGQKAGAVVVPGVRPWAAPLPVGAGGWVGRRPLGLGRGCAVSVGSWPSREQPRDREQSKMRSEPERVTGKTGLSDGLGRGTASAGARDSFRRASPSRPESDEPRLPARWRAAPPSGLAESTTSNHTVRDRVYP